MKILAAREYAGDVVKWIWGAKYKGTPRNGVADAVEAVESFADYPASADLLSRDVVVDVPGRIGGKTHELAPLLASAAASRLSIPHWVDVIERTREAPPMRRMGREERKTHVKGLYRVQKVPGIRAAVKGKRVLVVDDVSTTGATLHEIERVLLKAGAADVVGLVLAKVKKKKGAPVAKKKAKKKAAKKPPATPARKPGVRQVFIVKLPGGRETSPRSRRALALAKAKARRIEKHAAVVIAFAWYRDLAKAGEAVEIVAHVWATTETEARQVVDWASFAGGGRKRR